MFLAKTGVVRGLECVSFCGQWPGDCAEIVHVFYSPP